MNVLHKFQIYIIVHSVSKDSELCSNIVCVSSNKEEIDRYFKKIMNIFESDWKRNKMTPSLSNPRYVFEDNIIRKINYNGDCELYKICVKHLPLNITVNTP